MKYLVLVGFSLRITAVILIEFTRAQFNHRIVPGQAVKQFTSTSCLHFRRKLKLLYMLEQRFSANDLGKDNMIKHNKSDLRRPGIEPGSPDSQSNALHIARKPDGLNE
jgi:hypothetical protein